MKEVIMKGLKFIGLHKGNEKHCAEFKSLFGEYFAEQCEHNPKLRVSPNPHYTFEEFLQKWLNSIIDIQGDSDRHLELCYDSEHLIGFLYGKVDHEDHNGFIKPGWGYVMEFYVKPKYRRKSYGRAMSGRLERLFAADGATMMYLNADAVTGEPFWSAMGFTKTDEINTENNKRIWVKELSKYSCEKMTEDDIAFVVEILNSPKNKSTLNPASLAFNEWKTIFEQNLSDTDEVNFIIRRGIIPVAWIKLNGLSGEGMAWISMLVVHENYHRQGVGSYAIQYAEEYIHKKGFTAMGIHANTENSPAVNCYKKAGYVITEEGDCTNGDGSRHRGYTFYKDHLGSTREKMGVDDYTFSLATREDIPAIVSIYRSLVGTPGCTWDYEYPSQETAEQDIARQELFVLKKGGSIVAVASAGAFDELSDLSWKSQTPCELARIGVPLNLQNQGIGTEILRRVMEAVKAKGFDGIRMLVAKTNFSALALYEKNGFERCGEVSRFNHDYYCYEIGFE
jgi:ribosomal protein S18 acetylase RimI-like enzyme